MAILFLLTHLIPATITADYSTYEAINHIGSDTKVCGFCVGGMVERREKGSPTYLYFEYLYNKAVFKVKIWDFDRKKFKDPPEQTYKDKAVCVTGVIDAEEGIPFINVTEPGQLEFMKQYKEQTEEEAALEDSAKYQNMMFRPRDRVALKLLLRDLGYDIKVADDSWGMDAYRAVIAYQKEYRLKVTGKIMRKDFFKMEDAISNKKDLPYETQKKDFYIIQKLLKRQM
jgi:hypothetical protein